MSRINDIVIFCIIVAALIIAILAATLDSIFSDSEVRTGLCQAPVEISIDAIDARGTRTNYLAFIRDGEIIGTEHEKIVGEGVLVYRTCHGMVSDYTEILSVEFSGETK